MSIKSYLIPAGAAAGRVINTLLRQVKKYPAQKYYLYGAKTATISGSWEVILRKYRSRLKKINHWGQGPYRQKTAARLLKRMIRGMLDYKGKQSEIYRKIIIDPEVPAGEDCKELDLKVLKLHNSYTLEDIARAL